jgi:hypothetical protein
VAYKRHEDSLTTASRGKWGKNLVRQQKMGKKMRKRMTSFGLCIYLLRPLPVIFMIPSEYPTSPAIVPALRDALILLGFFAISFLRLRGWIMLAASCPSCPPCRAPAALCPLHCSCRPLLKLTAYPSDSLEV